MMAPGDPIDAIFLSKEVNFATDKIEPNIGVIICKKKLCEGCVSIHFNAPALNEIGLSRSVS